MTMTPDARRALATTIRTLRARLLDDLHAATESAYRLSIRAQDAGLDEAARARRSRLDAWIAEQRRAQGVGRSGAKGARTEDDFRREAEKQAAYTLLHRLVLLRLLESPGADDDQGRPTHPPLRSPAVVSGGWESPGYRDFRQLAPALVRGDETEGYAFLLQLVFEDLATDLPGLYGTVGVADLVPVPAATLRHVVDALNAPVLESCWRDDMTLGWVYQYWNDPEREALDARIHAGGKVAPHEIASKTQMFTERYMVDWLLQNSLGPMWLAICRRNGWTPEVEATGSLAALEARRQDWRARREAGEFDLTALMPLHTDAERRWAYYLPQPLPEGAVKHAPASLRDLKLLDPAVGSGHFLVVALDLLVALYREEARHRGETDSATWSDRAIVERILSHNLHGIDLDPRAVQIAAAALWLKARQVSRDARPERLNLVASQLRLAGLPDDDPALDDLRLEVEQETGIPGGLTDTLLHALRGADHLGSLLRVDQAVEEELARFEWADAYGDTPAQQDIFMAVPQQRTMLLNRETARTSIMERLEAFLEKQTGADDLGLRLRGEQLAAGVRFVRMVQPGTYHLVVANPPYQGTSRMAETTYVARHYPLGKADLYAAFLLRGLELVRPGGVSAMLTMRNWMFIKQYAGLRAELLSTHGLMALGDFDRGAFESVPDEVVSVTVSVFRRSVTSMVSEALCPTPRDDTSRDADRTHRKRAATLCHQGRCTFAPQALKVVPEWPLVYWWDEEMLRLYQSAPLIGDVAPAKKGLCTGNDSRFLRRPYEVNFEDTQWPPTVHGGRGRSWLECRWLAINWRHRGLEQYVFGECSSGVAIRSAYLYFRRGVAFSMIGASFSARVHRFPSIFGDKGSSVFPEDLAGAVCAMNSTRARQILTSLNPSISFQVGDVNRLPLFPIADADAIFARVEAAFTVHESHREPSVEFRHPGPSPWRHAQAWAQVAVDRPEGAPLPAYVEELDPEPPTDHLSFALGVALGRFGAPGTAQEGVLDPTTADLGHALPHGILFLDTTLGDTDLRDGLGEPAAAPLHEAWATHGSALGGRRNLRTWLAHDFFREVHRSMYENRPIHWPLSSPRRTFVAWVTIHRFTGQTLQVLLADHLMPTLTRLDGLLHDLRTTRDGADPRAARAAERLVDQTLKARDDLQAFIDAVEACADRGAPPTDAKCPPREQDVRYAPHLDDGVMINAAALWPLLDPQWKDPAKWWKELATAAGRKDYDWSHLAMRCWPSRVDAKCRQDPSLGVAHGCFWRYHPARAWAWELRLQDEIGPTFRIQEPPYQPGGRDVGDPGDAAHRKAWLADHPDEALAAVEKEALRRMGRGGRRRVIAEVRLLEPGLWSGHAELVWALELRLAEKQAAEVRIVAPDEPEARARYEAAHPGRVEARVDLLARLAAHAHLLAGEDDAAEDADEEDVDGDEEEEEEE
jgi:hypothetical protein